MEYDFPKVMRARTDAELLEIVTAQRDDYEPDALLAADAELARRELSAPRLQKAEARIARKNQALKQRSSEPLGVGWTVLVMLFPGALALLIARALKAEGYDRKHREVWRYTLYGVLGYVMLAVVLTIVSSGRAPR